MGIDDVSDTKRPYARFLINFRLIGLKMAYYDNVNYTLLELIDPKAKNICEFGCGAGAMARAIKAKLPALAVESIIGCGGDDENGLSVMEDLEPLARNLGVDPDELIRRGQVLQFVLVGRKPA